MSGSPTYCRVLIPPSSDRSQREEQPAPPPKPWRGGGVGERSRPTPGQRRHSRPQKRNHYQPRHGHTPLSQRLPRYRSAPTPVYSVSKGPTAAGGGGDESHTQQSGPPAAMLRVTRPQSRICVPKPSAGNLQF